MTDSVIRYSRPSNMTVFRSDSPLSDGQIHHYAPSVYATEKHESRGARYAFISTREVLEGLRREGFQPVEVRQTRTRKEGKAAFTKHMLRFRHPDLGRANNGDAPEIVLLNSHDGTSSYRLVSGWFRMICTNGLIAGDIQNDVKVRHSGNVVNDVIEGAFRVVDDLKMVSNQVEEMRSISVDRDEANLLALTAAQIRWDGEEAPVDPARLLDARRFEDRQNDLWHTFNRLQENVVKGGVAGRTTTGRNMSTRAITGVTENVRVNRALWQMADAFAALKTGALDPRELQARIAAADPELSAI